MINSYIKKPVVIEACKWRGSNLEEIMNFLGSEFKYEENTSYCTNKFIYDHTKNDLSITTLEGVMKASAGDFIIKGVNGEFYPCNPDVFDKTYNPVNTSLSKNTKRPLTMKFRHSNVNDRCVIVEFIYADNSIKELYIIKDTVPEGIDLDREYMLYPKYIK